RFGVVAGEWGFTRLADYRDPANPKLIGEYTIPETRQYPPAPGSFSVHNPWVVGDTLYLSHYYAGVRVVDIADPSNPVELAYLVPGGRPLQNGGEAHSNIWGVITDENGLIYLSDITSGLWIIGEKTPAQKPTPTTVPTSVPPQPPTPTPVPTPGGGSVCPQIQGRVPAAAIQAAMANPGRIAGYRQPMDPAKPVSPFNPRRLMLSLRTYGKPYHPVFNSLVFKVGCP
ncbi:MAG: LVIVD repeat-containing protein, partial [Anaerolineae bacterium]